MYQIMTFKEIVDFIEKMPNNSYASIASEYAEGLIDASGWWSIAKLSYADSRTLLFNWYGGGFPYSYTIDETSNSETVSEALRAFISMCDDFEDCGGYCVDTDTKMIWREDG